MNRIRRLLFVAIVVPVVLAGCGGSADEDDGGAAAPGGTSSSSPEAEPADAGGYTLPMKLACEALSNSLPDEGVDKTDAQFLAEAREGMQNLVSVTGGQGVNVSDLSMDAEFEEACPDVRERALTSLKISSLDEL